MSTVEIPFSNLCEKNGKRMIEQATSSLYRLEDELLKLSLFGKMLFYFSFD